MNNKLLLSVTGVWLLATGIAHAAVFERDLIPGSGDGLLTFDDVNNREWLDLTESLVIDLGERAPDDSFSFDYQRDLISELEPGGMFEGFQAATTADVVALAQSAGIDTNSNDFLTNGVPVGALIDLLGPTWAGPVSSGAPKAFAFGLTADVVPNGMNSIRNQRVEFLFSRRDDEPDQSSAALLIDVPSDLARSNTVGMMLYRHGVPEPSTIALGLVSYSLLAMRRFRSKGPV